MEQDAAPAGGRRTLLPHLAPGNFLFGRLYWFVGKAMTAMQHSQQIRLPMSNDIANVKSAGIPCH